MIPELIEFSKGAIDDITQAILIDPKSMQDAVLPVVNNPDSFKGRNGTSGYYYELRGLVRQSQGDMTGADSDFANAKQLVTAKQPN